MDNMLALVAQLDAALGPIILALIAELDAALGPLSTYEWIICLHFFARLLIFLQARASACMPGRRQATGSDTPLRTLHTGILSISKYSAARGRRQTELQSMYTQD